MLFHFAKALAGVSALVSCMCSPATAESTTGLSVQISYQYLNSPSKNHLATVEYDSNTLKTSLASWTPPSLDSLKSSTPESVSQPLLRILVPTGSSTLTSMATFNNTLNQTLDLWLSPSGDGTIFSASISASAPLTLKELKEKARADRHAKRNPKAKKSKKQMQDEVKANANIKVNLIAPTKGPSPKLVSRKAPVVGADGQEVPVEEEQEKSFFQKYWWIFLIGAIFAMSGGAGGS